MISKMEHKIIEIIKDIIDDRGDDEVIKLENWNSGLKLREDLGFTSFELALLTVNIEEIYDVDIFEDGLVSSLGEILLILKANK